MDLHSKNLERLILNLQWINEDPLDVKWVIKEGVWRPKQTGFCVQMPDIIASFHSGKFLVAELKHTYAKLSKAQAQIYNGARFLIENYGASRDRITGKFVVYDDNEKFNYMRLKI